MVAEFFKKRNRKALEKSVLYKGAGIFILVTVVFLALANFKMFQKKKQLADRVASYERQIQEIEKSNQALQEEIANVGNLDYLEKIAYEQLGQQRPGEKEIIFIAPEKKQENSAVQQNFWDTNPWLGWLSGAWDWIKNKF